MKPLPCRICASNDDWEIEEKRWTISRWNPKNHVFSFESESVETMLLYCGHCGENYEYEHELWKSLGLEVKK